MHSLSLWRRRRYTLMNKTLSIGCLLLISNIAQGSDIRALSMGGAAISAGQGVNGAFANPALLGTYRNRGVTTFRTGFVGELRDNAQIISDLDENEQLIDDLNAAVDAVLSQPLNCNPLLAAANNVCLVDNGGLGGFAADLRDLLTDINGEPFDARVTGGIGFAMASSNIPFAINFGTSVTATGTADISNNDLGYVNNISDALADNTITQGEILANTSISVAPSNTSLQIDLPDDVLDSDLVGSAVVRAQLSLSLAGRFDYGEYEIDFGITPKISSLRVGNIRQSINDDDTSSARDAFEASEADKTTYTVDVGATTVLPHNTDVRISGVIRNLVPEKIESTTGFEVETTPQLIVSAMYFREQFAITADLALNEAKYDNFETQTLNLGTELTNGPVSLRLGVSNDFSASRNPATLAVGLGIGNFDIGVRASESAIQAGMQIALDF